jgi:muramoyltetrapeptide carboxypeptidase LdcA involved in peptidoglycan recycling
LDFCGDNTYSTIKKRGRLTIMTQKHESKMLKKSERRKEQWQSEASFLMVSVVLHFVKEGDSEEGTVSGG